jgi:hypothetical protein
VIITDRCESRKPGGAPPSSRRPLWLRQPAIVDLALGPALGGNPLERPDVAGIDPPSGESSFALASAVHEDRQSNGHSRGALKFNARASSHCCGWLSFSCFAAIVNAIIHLIKALQQNLAWD